MKHCLCHSSKAGQWARPLQQVVLFKNCLLSAFFLLFCFFAKAQTTVTGKVLDSSGKKPLQGVTVTANASKRSVITDAEGNYRIQTAGNDSRLLFSYVGMKPFSQNLTGAASYDITMVPDISGLNDVVVVGYGAQKKGSLTAAISTVTSKDIDRVHAGSTVSTSLAGKLPGVTFRMSDGRPGASAGIQIRNMGKALYVIDGIQQDEGQFNNLAPNDIESISVLKDASAAIYGVRAANGVVVVTTKKGTTGRNNINVDAYAGWQRWFRFPKVLNNSYDYMRYMAEAQINSNGSTNITQEELEKYKQGESAGKQYRSFDWRKFVMSNNNAPQNSINVNVNGGSDKINYYASGTRFFQNSVLGSEYEFSRTNIQSNLNAKLTSGLRAGIDVNGRIESRENPGVPGLDDYWLARFAVLRNNPTERPYANDNPAYLNDIGHIETNYAYLNEKISGKLRSDWRVLQTNFHVDFDIPGVKGLTLRALYSYYIADYVLNNHEYTYNGYKYEDSVYKPSGGSTNPWREREQIKQINTTIQGQLSYNNTFGKHTVGATVVAERLKSERTRNWIHASPVSNNLPLIYFPTSDRYEDSDDKQARVGYIARVTYSYANTYFLELSGRRDASYLFPPNQRVGYFPGFSAGWRITQEPFLKKFLEKGNILTDFKIRASYGILGDDTNPYDPLTPPIVPPYAYLSGYNYNQGIAILDGNAVTVSRDKGIPITNLTWIKSRITDIGADFVLLNGKLSGSFDYFYRKRTGLPQSRNDVVVPIEIGYTLPQENLRSDAQYGEEFSLGYNGRINGVTFNVGGNISFTRSKYLSSNNPTFSNSWEQYHNLSVDNSNPNHQYNENRFSNYSLGYTVLGQFSSQEQISNYPVNIDGQGNRTLLPGDLIYKDFNGDNKIDGFDERPIGYGLGAQPTINFGFTIGAVYKNFDFHADFSGAAGYTWNQNWEMRWPFQNGGNLNTIFLDRWHREDPFDQNSKWIPGKYPALRNNPGTAHSNYTSNSTFWLHNVKQFRARTLELGYVLPQTLTQRIKIQRARFYINAYNLFSIDNLKEYSIDPEIIDDNGLQFPQSKVLNIGMNLSF
jgi:TonB-linked SusC/RagA family outer membrane protein